MCELQHRVSSHKLEVGLASHQKQYHAAVSKLGKQINKEAEQDLYRCCERVAFDPASLNQAVVEHLVFEGHTACWQRVCKETGTDRGPQEAKAEALRSIKQAAAALTAQDTAPALKWIAQHIIERSVSQDGLVFMLHQLEFGALVRAAQPFKAMLYGKQHLSAFSDSFLPSIKKLFGCLSCVDPCAVPRYKAILDECDWVLATSCFVEQACLHMELPGSSHLQVAVEAGMQRLPTVLKTLRALEARGMWSHGQPVPVQLEQELPEHLRFHSVFICPVSRELCSESNPAVLLPCNHVICRTSMNNLLRHNSSRFKCPYCPLDVHTIQAKDIYFY
eukprot:TRINITY_DN15263_c0_g1_i2.p1 TRINITY_DN15263_c0_g1~~TRINITY_DN15263_c0_g1_i2.p1  ORF type:complete len:333 (-),score=93.82 TRINITY_DN15263_c0_g1_i2:171-1169(-)